MSKIVVTDFNKVGIIEKSISLAIRINQNIVNLVESLSASGLVLRPLPKFQEKFKKIKWNDIKNYSNI